MNISHKSHIHRTANSSYKMQTKLLIDFSSRTSSTMKKYLKASLSDHLAIPRKTTSPKSLIRHSSSENTPPYIKSTLSTNHNPTSQLDWNKFFELRTKRRWYQQFFSIGTGLGSFVGGAQVLTYSDTDALVTQIPLDPFITLGLITFTCGGMGWLLGPAAGTAIFNWQNRALKAQIDEREMEFFKRVKRHRVDPSNSSMANPVPDYYGEKVSSVAGYRQWLKDCRAFNKKRTTYLN